MVSDVGDDDQIFGHRKQRVNAGLAVRVVAVEEVHGRGDADVVRKLESSFQSKTLLFENVFRFFPESRLKESLAECHVECRTEEKDSETRSVQKSVLAGRRCERKLKQISVLISISVLILISVLNESINSSILWFAWTHKGRNGCKTGLFYMYPLSGF